jgi:hypothetical protein
VAGQGCDFLNASFAAELRAILPRELRGTLLDARARELFAPLCECEPVDLEELLWVDAE